MSICRIALANIRVPSTADESVALAEEAIAEASQVEAAIVCFPEAYVPGYRVGRNVAPPDRAFLESAWARVASAAARAGVGVVLGTERVAGDALYLSALAVRNDGTVDGFQDKVQLDPSEDGVYTPGTERRLFECGPLKFGVVICHEGWRYPETVRWAVRQGAHLVFHPHFHEPEPGGYVPTSFADPANTFHEKAVMCRAAENVCYFASVNAAIPNSPTTSAVAKPDGTLLCWQPYGKHGLLVADIDTAQATGLLASRFRAAAV